MIVNAVDAVNTVDGITYGRLWNEQLWVDQEGI